MSENKVIWKFELSIIDNVEIEMPKNSKILSIKNQDSKLCMWVLCNPKNKKIIRKFNIVGTGNPINKISGLFIGTVLIESFVWHIFEESDPTTN